MRLFNCTPHSLVIKSKEGECKLAPSGILYRVSSKVEKVNEVTDDEFMTFEVYSRSFGELEIDDPKNLLAKVNADDILIVSSLVLEYVKNNNSIDSTIFYAPGELIRDENGNVIGCKGLAK